VRKVALITGITGQDGSYLSEILLKKNYIVHGIKRRSSSFNTERIDHIYIDRRYSTNFFLHYGDVLDYSSINALINKIKPNEIYNLAAQSHVAVSFQLPVYTAQVNAIGTLNILEVIRHSTLSKKIKFYQASSSEMYGLIQKKKQNEKTNFYPLSPYATSKVFAYWITRNYREAYNLFACNGILFNHESPRRGETFVTKKITSTLCKIALGYEKCLYLGNLNSLRDWGHAKEYAEMQWRMMQKKIPSDYVIATGKQYSVKQFVNKVCNYLQIKIKWIGKNKNEKAIVIDVNKIKCPSIKVGSIIVKVDKNYLRPMDVDNLIGDSRKAKKELKWNPKLSLDDLVKEMVDDDYKKTQKIL
jgi:GDPmannose 4,6-dehydratase